MSDRLLRLLLTGAPGAGKTTLVRRLVDELRAVGVPVGGFVTREVREHGRRVGFLAEEVGGGAEFLAHVRRADGPRVGRYRVDVPAFERIALPALEQAVARGGVVIIDELGPMELFSERFVHAVRRIFDQDVRVMATIHARSHPVTDELRARAGVELVEITARNRDEVFHMLRDRIVKAE